MMDGSVIVPLYVYPSLGAWGPIYDMASTYPGVQFTAIVNIYNGPGDGILPNLEYSQAIGMLNSLNNVRTIGYVATTWCARNLSSVLDEIAAYSFWGEYSPALAMNGIFCDETPTQYSPDYVSYLQTISQAVHDSPGLKDDFIVHNPGALPQPQYFDDTTSQNGAHLGPNLTIIFENSFINWTDQRIKLAEATKTYDPDKLALLIHSVPELSANETETILLQLLAVGHSIWLTADQTYTDFDAVLPMFIDRLDALLS